MTPAEVRVAAQLVRSWAAREVEMMRSQGVAGPPVMLLELVTAVMAYFLGCGRE